jgi:hypothetical protein
MIYTVRDEATVAAVFDEENLEYFEANSDICQRLGNVVTPECLRGLSQLALETQKQYTETDLTPEQERGVRLGYEVARTFYDFGASEAASRLSGINNILFQEELEEANSEKVKEVKKAMYETIHDEAKLETFLSDYLIDQDIAFEKTLKL